MGQMWQIEYSCTAIKLWTQIAKGSEQEEIEMAVGEEFEGG